MRILQDIVDSQYKKKSVLKNGGNNMVTWEFDGTSEIWRNDRFETVEEAIADAKKYGAATGDTIYIADCEEPDIRVDFSAVLSGVEENMYEQVGEVAEGWDISCIGQRKAIYETYEERLKELTMEYIREIGEEPGFYKCSNIRPVTVK